MQGLGKANRLKTRQIDAWSCLPQYRCQNMTDFFKLVWCERDCEMASSKSPLQSLRTAVISASGGKFRRSLEMADSLENPAREVKCHMGS